METKDAKQAPATPQEAARLRYETTLLTFDQVGDEFSVSGRTVKRWAAADGGWQKKTGPELAARAQVAADRISAAVADLPADAPEEAREAVVAQVRTEAAVDERAAILARHRAEWGIVRGLVAEAVRKRDAGGAKMAVDVGRALDLAQRGERRAWGLDAGEDDRPATIIIDRS